MKYAVDIINRVESENAHSHATDTFDREKKTTTWGFAKLLNRLTATTESKGFIDDDTFTVRVRLCKPDTMLCARPTDMVSVLEQVMNDAKTSDVTIVTSDGVRIPAHKVHTHTHTNIRVFLKSFCV